MADDFGGELEVDRAVEFLRSLPWFAPWFLRIELEFGLWSHFPRVKK